MTEPRKFTEQDFAKIWDEWVKEIERELLKEEEEYKKRKEILKKNEEERKKQVIIEEEEYKKRKEFLDKTEEIINNQEYVRVHMHDGERLNDDGKKVHWDSHEGWKIDEETKK